MGKIQPIDAAAPRKRQAFTKTTLERAAKIAVENGVTICLEAPDGTVARIVPGIAPSPIGATEREASECDKAFGLSG